MTYHGHWQEVAPDLLSFTLSAHHPPTTPPPLTLLPLRYPYHLPFLSPPLSEGPGSPTSPHHRACGLSWHSQCSGPIAPDV